jgi:hypothetical protein
VAKPLPVAGALGTARMPSRYPEVHLITLAGQMRCYRFCYSFSGQTGHFGAGKRASGTDSGSGESWFEPRRGNSKRHIR